MRIMTTITHILWANRINKYWWCYAFNAIIIKLTLNLIYDEISLKSYKKTHLLKSEFIRTQMQTMGSPP